MKALKKSTNDGYLPRDLVVRLESSPQQPETPVERSATAMLRREGSLPFHVLINRVAVELYQKESAEGAWLLDLAETGSRLFVPDVRKEIESGNGRLWTIEKRS